MDSQRHAAVAAVAAAAAAAAAFCLCVDLYGLEDLKDPRKGFSLLSLHFGMLLDQLLKRFFTSLICSGATSGATLVGATAVSSGCS